MTAGAVVAPGRWISAGWTVFKGDPGKFVLMTMIAAGLGVVGTIFVAGPLTAGLFLAVRRRMLEGRTDVSDVFSGFRYYVDAVLVSLLAGLFFLIGVALCILPALVVAALFLFAFLFLVDGGLNFWDAMQASRKLVAGNLLGFVGFTLLLGLLNLAGLALAGIGVLVTLPVSLASIAEAYRELAGFRQPVRAHTGPVIIV